MYENVKNWPWLMFGRNEIISFISKRRMHFNCFWVDLSFTLNFSLKQKQINTFGVIWQHWINRSKSVTTSHYWWETLLKIVNKKAIVQKEIRSRMLFNVLCSEYGTFWVKSHDNAEYAKPEETDETNVHHSIGRWNTREVDKLQCKKKSIWSRETTVRDAS